MSRIKCTGASVAGPFPLFPASPGCANNKIGYMRINQLSTKRRIVTFQKKKYFESEYNGDSGISNIFLPKKEWLDSLGNMVIGSSSCLCIKNVELIPGGIFLS